MASKDTVRPIVNRPLVMQMITLIDWVYHLGVEDAYGLNDEGVCRDFIEEASKPGVFGMLPNVYMGWREWSLRLMFKARMLHWNSAMGRYLDRVGRYGSNYLSCFYPVAQWYYNRGVKDYCDNPLACDMELFRSAKKAFWTARGLRSVKIQHYVDEIQLMCFDFDRRDQEIRARHDTEMKARKAGALMSRHYEYFIRAISLAADRRKIYK